MTRRGYFAAGVLVAAAFASAAFPAHADSFSSADYSLSAPEIAPGGLSTSADFSLLGVLGAFAAGTSSASSFAAAAGFLAYPFVSTPIISATPGDGQVALSWTAANGYLGFNPSGYALGQSTVSGGPYTFTSVGDVTSATRSGLANGTTYYFVVRVLDAFGAAIATSTQISGTPASSNNNGGNSGGGSSGGGSGGGGTGGGGIIPVSGASVVFSGYAYPNSTVTLLRDSTVAASTVAGGDARFSISLSGLAAGSYVFGVYTQDASGIRSALQTFPETLTAGASTSVGGIFIAPTIDVDKSTVKRGDNVRIFGQSPPGSDVTIAVHSDAALFLTATSDESGAYLYTLDTAPLEEGSHSAESKAATGGQISDFGAAVAFAVGTQNVAKRPGSAARGDLNGDGRVDLVDFSIMAYWYGRALSGAGLGADLNGDGAVTLTDFSILVSHWTG